jgi:hypothetical protein
VDKSTVLRLSHQAENEYLAFYNELQKLEVLEYPTEACGVLIENLKTQATKNLDTITQIRNDLVQGASSTNAKLYRDSILTERRKLFEVLTNFLEWINSAQTQKVPWSFIPSVERLSEKIISDYTPVLYCKNLYNYGIHWYRELAGSLDKYRFVSLPRLHRTNILMHTLIGHELFHPCCEEFTDEHENEVAQGILAEVEKAFPDVNSEDLFGKSRLDEINEYLMDMWRRALHELLCDMFCAELFGPAALLAMRAYAYFSEWKIRPGRENNFYPPWQYRFEVVWQHVIKSELGELCTNDIEENEIIQPFKDEVEAFGENLESNEGLTFVYSDSLNKIAYSEVDKLLSDACSYVKSKLPESVSKWTDGKVLKQIPELVTRLGNGIPPNEIPNISFDEDKNEGSYSPEPAELSAILIAGWMYQIYREKNEADKDLLSYDTLSRLLLKACEDSEMIRCNKTGGIA